MYKITNKQKSPVQILILSRRRARSFTVCNIPGIGAGKNIYYLEDERKTEYVDRVENMGLIEVSYIPNNSNKTKQGE